ncbi:MAG: hypothetical protein ACO377_14025, partial [Pseudomonadales bacterium]
MTRRAALFLALALAGCDREEAPAQEPVDLLLYNGTVLVLDEAGTQASAMAVRGDRIIAVGDDSLRERFDPDEALDLGGKTIMPGFVDSHIHVSGSPQRYVDLMQGVADATGMTLMDVWKVEIFPEVIKASCTMFGAWNNAT